MLLQILSPAALLLSAAFWFASAATPIPKRVDVSFSGTGEDVDRLVKRLHLQSRLNGAGAIFAAVGVILALLAKQAQ